MPTCRYGIKLCQREAGAVLSYKWACESRAIHLNNTPLSLVFYPSHFWFLSEIMGKSFRPPGMQMQHTRAARGISSKLDDFLKVGTNQASVFSKLLGKNTIWLRPRLCNSAQTSADTGGKCLVCSHLERHIQQLVSRGSFVFISKSKVQ